MKKICNGEIVYNSWSREVSQILCDRDILLPSSIQAYCIDNCDGSTWTFPRSVIDTECRYREFKAQHNLTDDDMNDPDNQVLFKIATGEEL